MPYITEVDRAHVRKHGPSNAGELNYAITVLINLYIVRNGLNYSRINDVVGALECAKREFQRRTVDGYEQKKLLQNGDVP